MFAGAAADHADLPLMKLWQKIEEPGRQVFRCQDTALLLGQTDKDDDVASDVARTIQSGTLGAFPERNREVSDAERKMSRKMVRANRQRRLPLSLEKSTTP